MTEQLTIAEQRLNQLHEQEAKGGIAYKWLTDSDLTDRYLPLETFHQAQAQPSREELKDVVIRGYKKAVGKVSDTDPETQEDLTRFKNSVNFTPLTL
ncbi:MAG: hypothetical protein L6R38_006645, partial [Xanthoria sp. 2 TBL-2021]